MSNGVAISEGGQRKMSDQMLSRRRRHPLGFRRAGCAGVKPAGHLRASTGSAEPAEHDLHGRHVCWGCDWFRRIGSRLAHGGLVRSLRFRRRFGRHRPGSGGMAASHFKRSH